MMKHLSFTPTSKRNIRILPKPLPSINISRGPKHLWDNSLRKNSKACSDAGFFYELKIPLRWLLQKKTFLHSMQRIYQRLIRCELESWYQNGTTKSPEIFLKVLVKRCWMPEYRKTISLFIMCLEVLSYR